MRSAIALTLFFAAATSLLGARVQLARATGQRRYWTAVAVASAMAAWMAVCGLWLLAH